MAMKVRYYGIEGELLGDSVAGDYMRDALGSVVGTTSSTTGAVMNTYRFKPYGERLSKTGAATDPNFQWVGTYGYRETAIAHSKSYVRARHYAQEEGRWNTVDPLRSILQSIAGGDGSIRWAWLQATLLPYHYSVNPIQSVDFSGLDKQIGPVPPGKSCKGVTDRGITNCNEDKGEPYSLICNKHCSAPCTERHEEAIRKAYADCCKLYAKCVRKYGLAKCTVSWAKWLGGNFKYIECKATTAGKKCREQLIISRGCRECAPGKRSPCCKTLIQESKDDSTMMGFYCKDVDINASPPVSCPFKSNGDLW